MPPAKLPSPPLNFPIPAKRKTIPKVSLKSAYAISRCLDILSSLFCLPKRIEISRIHALATDHVDRSVAQRGHVQVALGACDNVGADAEILSDYQAFALAL